jgi:hypothetical protein
MKRTSELPPSGAERSGQSECRVAVLDVNLNGQMSYPIANPLAAVACPSVFDRL